ncbi:MAG: type 2 isopentenyl-diphosphate Delta-isomerase [Candidatus Syntropharchaeia archaeon]
MKTQRRKMEHLILCAEEEVESKGSGFDDVLLIHNALPEIDKEKIDLSVEFLGKKLSSPLMIASMTGGHPDTKKVNEALASAAEELKIGMGVGSQRAALEDKSAEDSFRVVRDVAPSTFIYGNIGAAQLREYGIEGIERIVEMIDADAIAIHLNFLQEAIQPEGDTNASGCLAEIRKICSSIKVPVIVKETGAGISHAVAHRLCEAGVSAIDVGGLGGTSWGGVEVYRAKAEGNKLSEHLGKLFWNWGIPTVVSIVECASFPIPIIATGGIRTGIDVAKSIALGADVSSTALPLVKPAIEGKEEVIRKIKTMNEELRIAMFLCGCESMKDLSSVQVVITGRTREILEQRGFRPQSLSLR